jgi:hypothetical protein
MGDARAQTDLPQSPLQTANHVNFCDAALAYA